MDELVDWTHKLQQLMNENPIQNCQTIRRLKIKTVLYYLSIYKQKALDIFFDSDNLFSNLGQLLEGPEYESYATARAAGPTNNMAAFDACMRQFVLNCCRTNTKKYQYQHNTTVLFNYSKPLKMSVRQHANYLAMIHKHVNTLHPAGQYQYELMELHQKELLLHLVPDPCQKDFLVSNKNIEMITYNELVDWLEQMKEHADEKFAKAQEKRKRDSDSSSS